MTPTADTMTTCHACQSLAAIRMQCNKHRREQPNATTLRRAAIVAYMREHGVTAAEAEAMFGARPVVVN